MPEFTVIAEVVHTRSYQITAKNQDEAMRAVADEFSFMPFDTLEEEIDTAYVEESN